MANEITISSIIGCVNGNLTIPTYGGGFTIDQTTAGGGGPGFVTIGTTHEAISLGDLTTDGWAWFKNLDATNYVEIGLEVSSTFYPLIEMQAGEVAGPFRIASSSGAITVYAKADTAACDIQAIVLED